MPGLQVRPEGFLHEEHEVGDAVTHHKEYRTITNVLAEYYGESGDNVDMVDYPPFFPLLSTWIILLSR